MKVWHKLWNKELLWMLEMGLEGLDVKLSTFLFILAQNKQKMLCKRM